MKKTGQRAAVITAAFVAALVLVVDQISKYLITVNFHLGESRVVVDGVLNFTYINNSGAAFGLFKDQTWMFLALTIVIIMVCLAMLIRKTYENRIVMWSIMLILSGGLGNLIDRIFRAGQVIDFFELTFIRFAIFNVADCAVTVGAGLLVLYFIVDLINNIRRRRNGEDDLPEESGDLDKCEQKD